MDTVKARKPSRGSPYHRIVVKLGTSLLTGGTIHLDAAVMSNLVGQVAQLHKQSQEIFIVSSGAIAAGRSKLGLTRGRERKHLGIPFKQVLASVGQSRLMNVYEQLFAKHSITVAQALLTRADLTGRDGYLNARGTLLALLELRVLCIVNENDVVAVDELQDTRFGDNDNLSAMVANLVDADLLLILSDIAGLHTADPHYHSNACLISQVERITPEIESLVTGSVGNLGTGGMVTKLEAAKMATASGVSVVIADGREPGVIPRVAAGELIGTYFPTATSKLESRERWLLSGLSTKGRLVVDSGCARALKRQKGSLLAVGVVGVEGEFERGDVVEIFDAGGSQLGCGLTNYGSADIERIKGAQSGKIVTVLGYDYGAEVLHRNNLVVL
ncbi:MAG: glutamate 5-kinase [Dehalococcoidales bacterium]|nr:glutamate 5-kinase [Dehalococcoidales bacterium]|tara:strand:- start:494 stop:1654 length:1161 start_codon:yes stop_codon:yes gene_type:complete